MNNELNNKDQYKQFSDLPLNIQNLLDKDTNTRGLSREVKFEKYILKQNLKSNENYDEFSILQKYTIQLQKSQINLYGSSWPIEKKIVHMIQLSSIPMNSQVSLDSQTRIILLELLNKLPLLVSIQFNNIKLDYLEADLLQNVKFLEGLTQFIQIYLKFHQIFFKQHHI